MYQLLAPLETETVKQDREHLEVVVLFVAHDINHLVDGVVLETHLGSANVLGHIYRRAVRTQQQLLVEPLVGEVGPHRVVIMTLKDTLGETLLYLGLSFQIGLAFIVDLVEAHAHLLVGLVEAGIDPRVHLLPQGAYLGIVLFPLHQHLVSLLDKRSLLLCFLLVHALSHELLHLLTIMLVEADIVVANEMVTLLATRLGSLTIAVFQPSQHRLTDMYTAVIHDVGLHHLIAVGLHDLSQRPA